MNNNKAAARQNLESADRIVVNRLLDIPREQRGPTWSDVYYGSGFLNDRKWAKFVKANPADAAKLADYRENAVRAKAAYVEARDADKARLERVRAERAAKAAYKEANGARPEERGPNPHAPHNFDILTAALADVRTQFVDECVRVRLEVERRQWEAERAEVLSKPSVPEWRRRRFEAGFPALARKTQIAEGAKAEFDSYVAKLATKIEARVASVGSLTGSLWHGSNLTVNTDAGTQVWNTACKRNARYGDNAANGHYTEFYQFPTTRVS